MRFHVHTTAPSFDLEITRDGRTPSRAALFSDLGGKAYPTPADCSVTGCNWPVALDVTVPNNWDSGGYLVTLTAKRGRDTVEEHHLFVVRRATGANAAPILLLCATPTWLAYNCWGGSNAYEGITGPDGDQFSSVLTTQRPWTRGF